MNDFYTKKKKYGLKKIFNLHFKNYHKTELWSDITNCIEKFKTDIRDKTSYSIFKKAFGVMPSEKKILNGIVIKILDNKTIKVITRYLYHIKKLDVKIFKYSKFLVHVPEKIFNINDKKINIGDFCLFFFTSFKFSKKKYSCVYNIIKNN